MGMTNPATPADSLQQIFRALAEPHRRRLFDLVSEREWSAGELHRALQGPSFGAISQHLARLSQAGLIQVRSEGKNRFYNGVPEALASLRQWLAGHRDAPLGPLPGQPNL